MVCSGRRTPFMEAVCCHLWMLSALFGGIAAFYGCCSPILEVVLLFSEVVMPPCFATRYCHLQRQCHHFWRQCCHFGCSTSIYGCSATVFGGSADVFFWGGHVQHNEAGREWMCLDLGSVRQVPVYPESKCKRNSNLGLLCTRHLPRNSNQACWY